MIEHVNKMITNSAYIVSSWALYIYQIPKEGTTLGDLLWYDIRQYKKKDEQQHCINTFRITMECEWLLYVSSNIYSIR